MHSMNSKQTEVSQKVSDTSGNLDIRSLLKTTIEDKQDPELVAYGTSGSIGDPVETSVEELTPQLTDTDMTDWDKKLLEEEESREAQGLDTASEEMSEESAEASELSASAEELLDSVTEVQPDQQSTVPDIETVMVKAENGRKQKVRIDYNDRAAVKQAYLKAAGMRKFQAERDKVKKEYADIQSKYDELNGTYSQLNDAYQKSGVKGVIQLLAGEEGIEKFVNDELQHREYVDSLSPDEKYKLQLEERERKYQDQLSAERARREQFEQVIREKEEQAATLALESKLTPAFDRYRFSGKLSDPVVESQLDTAIWTQVTERLSEYPDEVELTQALIDKEFRTVANNFKKIINTQTEKKVKATIDKKKTEATKKAQLVAKKGLSDSSHKRKFVSDIKSGNIGSAFADIFAGKIKL